MKIHKFWKKKLRVTLDFLQNVERKRKGSTSEETAKRSRTEDPNPNSNSVTAASANTKETPKTPKSKPSQSSTKVKNEEYTVEYLIDYRKVKGISTNKFHTFNFNIHIFSNLHINSFFKMIFFVNIFYVDYFNFEFINVHSCIFVIIFLGKEEVLVHWEGNYADTWEPVANLNQILKNDVPALRAKWEGQRQRK